MIFFIFTPLSTRKTPAGARLPSLHKQALLVGVIEDDGAADRDTELIVSEILVNVIKVRAVWPERSTAIEHCTHTPPQQQ